MPIPQAAFAWEVTRLRPVLLALARRWNQCSAEDAEDLVQQTLLSALRGLPEYRGSEESLGDWLERILWNVILSLHKSALQQVVTCPLDLANEVPSPPTQPPALLERLHPLIKALDPKYRQVLYPYLAGYTKMEIAEKLQLHRNTVSNRLQEIQLQLNVRLGAFESTESTLFDQCAQVSIYQKPTGVWIPWTSHHPPERSFSPRRPKQRKGEPC